MKERGRPSFFWSLQFAPTLTQQVFGSHVHNLSERTRERQQQSVRPLISGVEGLSDYRCCCCCYCCDYNCLSISILYHHLFSPPSLPISGSVFFICRLRSTAIFGLNTNCVAPHSPSPTATPPMPCYHHFSP